MIDQTNTRLGNAFAAHGLQLGTQIEYVRSANDWAHYPGITTAITALRLLIVAISPVALINTITVVVFEIGIPRCISAHARDVRRVFRHRRPDRHARRRADWDPPRVRLAYGIGALVQNVLNQRVQFTFPALNIPCALIGTLVLAPLMQIPLLRAGRFKPGKALKYA